jgi:translation initiation factor 1
VAKKDGNVVDPRGGSSLGDLLKAKGLAASAPEPSAAAKPTVPSPAEAGLGGRLVLRRSKKGRGGKTATTIEGVTGTPAALDALASRLKKGLGCGAGVEDGVIVVQGDQGDRVEALLRSWGAERIIRG